MEVSLSLFVDAAAKVVELTDGPDLKPHAIVAAANLTIYDDAYAKLRAEYMGVSLFAPYLIGLPELDKD